jgi:hypothetical protein
MASFCGSDKALRRHHAEEKPRSLQEVRAAPSPCRPGRRVSAVAQKTRRPTKRVVEAYCTTQPTRQTYRMGPRDLRREFLQRKTSMSKIVAKVLLVTLIAGFAAACATTPPPAEKAPIVRKG